MKKDGRHKGAGAEAQTSSAQLALLRSAGEVAPAALGIEAELVDQLAADYSDATGAANLLLASALMPPEFRGFVDALVGLAGGRDSWFEASDKQIAAHAGRSTKWVQDWRKQLADWQTKNKASVIEIEDHYMDAEGGKHPHRYKVHLTRYAAACALEARASRDWDSNPQRAIAEAARVMRRAMPEPPAKNNKNQRRRPDAASLIHTRLKSAITLVRKAVELQGMTGGRVEIDAQLINELRGVLEKFSTTQEGKGEEVQGANR